MKFEDLIGKTIIAAQQMKLKEHDDTGFLRLQFSDNTHCIIEGGYRGYTVDSEDDYQTHIWISSDERELDLELYQGKGE
ncbi:MAG: hypothetical protein WC331_10400 [Candidatus Omnitrophota bacterium]